MSIQVRYIYSACIVSSTPDVRILNDPWFTDGIYDGSWYHFPAVRDPLSVIGDVDLIYISHIHPDHYDPSFLKTYFRKYGEKPILIAAHQPNHLAGKMRGDGLTATILDVPKVIGRTTVEILPHKTGSISDIDSAIIVHHDDGARRHTVVNANDIVFDEPTMRQLKDAAPEPDILLCGYTGAGPYPQTYFELGNPELEIEAAKKKTAFFERYKALTKVMQAKVNIPFAGQYILGGKLAPLNPYRGVADAAEVPAFDPKAIVLADEGGMIDTSDLKPSAIRTEPFDQTALRRRLEEISGEPMTYEKLISEAEIHQLPLKRLLRMAVQNAKAKSECDSDHYFCIAFPSDDYAVINANRDAEVSVSYVNKGADLPGPRSEILIDPRYLFGLLTHVYHWNNAEVGSQFFTRRLPNRFDRRVQTFLNFLTV